MEGKGRGKIWDWDWRLGIGILRSGYWEFGNWEFGKKKTVGYVDLVLEQQYNTIHTYSA